MSLDARSSQKRVRMDDATRTDFDDAGETYGVAATRLRQTTGSQSDSAERLDDALADLADSVDRMHEAVDDYATAIDDFDSAVASLQRTATDESATAGDAMTRQPVASD